MKARACMIAALTALSLLPVTPLRAAVKSPTAFLDGAIAKDPGNAGLYLERGMARADAFNHAGACADYRKATELGLGTYLLHLKAGESLYWMNDMDGAATRFEKALAALPGDFTAASQLALCRAKTTVANAPFDAAGRIALAKALMNAGSYGPAGDECDLALRIDARNPEAAGLREKASQCMKADELNARGIESFDRSDLPGALRLHSEALELARRAGDAYLESRCLCNAGNVHSETGNLTAALDCYGRAIAIAKRLGYQKGIANYLGNIGQVHIRRGEYALAGERIGEALAISRKVGDRAGEANHICNEGNVHFFQGDFTAALERFERALSLAHNGADRTAENSFLGNTAVVFAQRGDYARALERYERALGICREIGDRKNEARHLGNIAIVYKQKGDYDTALAHYGKSLAIDREIGYRLNEANNLGNIAGLHYFRGEYARYLEYLKKAIETAEKIEYHYGILVWKSDIALYNAIVGNFGLSDRFFGDSLALAEKLGAKQRIAEIEGKYARLFIRKKDFAEAERRCARAAAIFTEIGQKPSLADANLVLAEVRLRAGKPASAIHAIDGAERIAREIGRKPCLAEAALLRGECLFALGKNPDAGASLERALALGRELHARDIVWRALLALGRHSETAGKTDAAIRHYAGSIEAIKEIAAALAEGDRIGFMSERLDAYERLVALLLKCGRNAEAMRYLNESKQFILKGAAAGDIRLGAADRRLYDRWVAMEAEAAGLTEKISRAGDRTSRDELEKRLAERRRESRSLLLAMEGNPAFGRVRYKTQKAINENQKLIPQGAIVMEYALSPAGGYLICIARDRFDVIPIRAKSDDIAADVTAYLKALRDQGTPGPEGERLYRTLVAPAGERLGEYRIAAIVAHGILNYLPFEALYRTEGGARRYLIEDIAVAYLPDGSLAPVIDAPARPGGGGSFIGFANGTLDLDGAEQEVKELAKLFPANAVCAYYRDGATKENFRRRASEFAIVHIATHGVIEKHDPLSHLEFHGGDRGRLTLQELKLDYPDLFTGTTRMAVLSACDTANSKNLMDPTGGEVISLASAFLDNRIASVVASLWPVDDESTGVLMIEFYTNMVRRGFPAGESLRRAKISLLKGKYPHPFNWAPFILIGDWR